MVYTYAGCVTVAESPRRGVAATRNRRGMKLHARHRARTRPLGVLACASLSLSRESKTPSCATTPRVQPSRDVLQPRAPSVSPRGLSMEPRTFLSFSLSLFSFSSILFAQTQTRASKKRKTFPARLLGAANNDEAVSLHAAGKLLER